MLIQDHRLVGVPFVRSPNIGGVLRPESIVIHYTAGPSAARAILTLTDPGKKERVSAHTVTDRLGSATQLVAFNRIAWHAGTSEWQGRPRLNHWAVGLELENYGFLRRNPAGQWVTWWGEIVPDSDVMIAVHKNGGKEMGWHKFTDKQIASVYAQCSALIETYPRIKTILGHDDIAPKRKKDPGPAFPLAALSQWVGLVPISSS